jgi:hypothetical protein
MNKRKTFIPGFVRGFSSNAALDADKSQIDDM